jgi:D-arabinose 5-phosphate isomerase GutQ
MSRPSRAAQSGQPGDGDAVATARSILAQEIEGIEQLAAAIDGSLLEALTVIERQVRRDPQGRRGRLVVTGVGKSGQIGA